jgi:hypothetical protein
MKFFTLNIQKLCEYLLDDLTKILWIQIKANNEKSCKKSIETYLRYYPNLCLNGLSWTKFNLSGKLGVRCLFRSRVIILVYHPMEDRQCIGSGFSSHIERVPDVLLVKGKAIPVTGRGGPYGCVTSRLSHFLDNRLTDGGDFVSLTRPAALYPQGDSWYCFLLETESTSGP